MHAELSLSIDNNNNNIFIIPVQLNNKLASVCTVNKESEFYS